MRTSPVVNSALTEGVECLGIFNEVHLKDCRSKREEHFKRNFSSWDLLPIVLLWKEKWESIPLFLYHDVFVVFRLQGSAVTFLKFCLHVMCFLWNQTMMKNPCLRSCQMTYFGESSLAWTLSKHSDWLSFAKDGKVWFIIVEDISRRQNMLWQLIS